MCERKPLAEDLKGFWDMVYYQVDSIDQKFMSFAEMESNNWTLAGQVSVKPQQSRHAKVSDPDYKVIGYIVLYREDVQLKQSHHQ